MENIVFLQPNKPVYWNKNYCVFEIVADKITGEYTEICIDMLVYFVVTGYKTTIATRDVFKARQIAGEILMKRR